MKDNKGSYSGAGFLIDAEKRWIATNTHLSSQNPESVEIAFKGQRFVDAKLLEDQRREAGGSACDRGCGLRKVIDSIPDQAPVTTHRGPEPRDRGHRFDSQIGS